MLVARSPSGGANGGQTFKSDAHVFPPMDFPKLLDGTQSLADIFEIVKRAVEQDLGYSRGGLMLGLADLGNHPQGFIGAFYPVATNVIVMNKVPLARI